MKEIFFNNQTVNMDKFIAARKVTVENVKINRPAKFTIKATNEVIINSSFEMEEGCEFEVII